MVTIAKSVEIVSYFQEGDWLRTEQGYLYELCQNPRYGVYNHAIDKKFFLKVGKEKKWYCGFILKYGAELFHKVDNGYESYAKKINDTWYVLEKGENWNEQFKNN